MNVFPLKKQIEMQNSQIISLNIQLEEKNASNVVNRQIIDSLQDKVQKLTNELVTFKEKNKDAEKNIGATALLKAEQDALLSSLRKDLKVALDSREELVKQLKSMEESMAKYKLLEKKLSDLEHSEKELLDKTNEQTALITRLRTESQTAERNHAMRTAMLAACEAQLDTLKNEIIEKDKTIQIFENNEKSVFEKYEQLEKDFIVEKENNKAIMQNLENENTQLKSENQTNAQKIKDEYELIIDNLKKEFSKKSAVARSLLVEREEEVNVMSAKIQELSHEISSGAPSERKIFELAQSQAKRDAMTELHR